jgi:hypothetical protein
LGLAESIGEPIVVKKSPSALDPKVPYKHIALLGEEQGKQIRLKLARHY